MILTVTLNPGLDYIADVAEVKTGKTNRTVRERFRPGGKGLNVSIVLKRLGEDTEAFAFTGGFTGEKLKSIMADSGVSCDFVDVPGSETRINVKLVTDRVTEVNGRGLILTDDLKNQLIQRLDKLTEEDILVLSGSLPKGADPLLYSELMSRIKCRTVLDTAGQALLEGLKYHPLLIKPNEEEIAQLAGIDEPSQDEIIDFSRKLQKLGARNVMVSLGKDGALLIAEDGTVCRQSAPDVSGTGQLYTVGAGDSSVAGFIHAYLNGFTPQETLKYAVCTGTASVVGDFLAEKETVEKLLKQ